MLHRGSPLAIALIGGILKDDHSESMWKEISEELEESHFDDFEIEDDLHYRHPSINASIELR